MFYNFFFTIYLLIFRGELDALDYNDWKRKFIKEYANFKKCITILSHTLINQNKHVQIICTALKFISNK